MPIHEKVGNCLLSGVPTATWGIDRMSKAVAKMGTRKMTQSVNGLSSKNENLSLTF